MRRRMLVMIAAGLVWGTPVLVRACSCFGTTEVGQSTALPENAALLLREACGGAGPASVLVDGAPAQLVPAHDALVPGGAFSWIEPAPAMGQRVTVVIEDDLDGSSEEHTLLVGQPDSIAPRLTDPIVTVSDAPNEGPCGEDVGADYDVMVEFEDENADGATVYLIDVYADGALIDTISRNRAIDGSVSASRAITGMPEEICVGVRAVDAAGHDDDTDRSCVGVPEGCQCTTGRADGWAAFTLLLLGLRRRPRR